MIATPLHFNRRAFLKTSAALAAGATFVGAAARSTAESGTAEKKNPAATSGKGRI
jgi:TAT (twin-arginine translocation) pathway signal sequence